MRERGFAKATLADIVRHAKVSYKTFYEHFANKEECFEAAHGVSLSSLAESEGKQRFGSPITHPQEDTPDAGASRGTPASEVARLPAGRHGIPREVVLRDQRERLLVGAAKAVEERGFAKATVSDIVRHAKVSYKTFYEHFANKEECFEAARGISLIAEGDKAS